MPNQTAPSKMSLLRGGIARTLVVIGLLLTFGWMSFLGLQVVKAVWRVADNAASASKIHFTDLPSWMD